MAQKEVTIPVAEYIELIEFKNSVTNGLIPKREYKEEHKPPMYAFGGMVESFSFYTESEVVHKLSIVNGKWAEDNHKLRQKIQELKANHLKELKGIKWWMCIKWITINPKK